MKEFKFLLNILDVFNFLLDTLDFMAKHGLTDAGLAGWLLMIIFIIGFFIKLDSNMTEQSTLLTRKLEPSDFPQSNKSQDRDSR